VRLVEREWLEEQLGAGRSFGDIAGEVGLNPSTVSYWVKKHGLAAPGAGRHAARGGIRRERLEALVAEDLSVRGIAERLDLSPGTVRYWLKRFGLDTSTNARRAAAREELEGICPTHGSTTFVRVGGALRCARCRADAVTRWRRQAKQTLVEEAGGRCVLCGYDRCAAALHFHHRDPATKAFGVGSRGLGRALDRLREEAAKCVLLCANCHTEVEAGVARLPLSLAAPAHVDGGAGGR
jgi:transposase-like protein